MIIARGFKLTFESPKSDKLALFELGERAYDHLVILPSKSKGTPTRNPSATTFINFAQVLDQT